MEKQEIGDRRQVDRQTYRFMGFREQAAAIPRVWSSATFPTILCLFLPLPSPSPSISNPCRNGIDGGGCKNFTANCLQTRPAARRYDREKQETPGKLAEKLVWVKSLLPACVLYPFSESPRTIWVSNLINDDIASFIRLEGFRSSF